MATLFSDTFTRLAVFVKKLLAPDPAMKEILKGPARTANSRISEKSMVQLGGADDPQHDKYQAGIRYRGDHIAGTGQNI